MLSALGMLLRWWAPALAGDGKKRTLHFKEEKSKAQGAQPTSPRSHSWEVDRPCRVLFSGEKGSLEE